MSEHIEDTSIDLISDTNDTDNQPKDKRTLHEEDNLSYKLPGGVMTYVLSFLLPVVILIAVYAAKKIYPFGDNCFLRSDMYHQYAPFFSELWQKLRNGETMTYSFDMGLGVNFVALFAYYLSCPLNWIIALFPHNNIIELMSVLIILKLALSSVTFTHYIIKVHGVNNISISIFGMFYALSAYVAAYCWNIMWLDCILLLPLIVLGLKRLVEEGKCMMYCITLGLAILSNYYISIMICLFIVIYFIALNVSGPAKTFKEFAKTAFNFSIFSLLAGGIAAILLIPELYALTYTVSSDINFPKTLSNYFPIMEILVRHLSFVEVHIGLENLPNIYCGVGVFLLIPLYAMNKNISTREKFSKFLVLAVFLLAFNLNIPNFIWHGLHYPNSLPCRQSFIYVFVVLTMCFDAVKDINEFDKKCFAISTAIALGFLLISEQAYSGSTYNFKIFYISAGFMIFYSILLYVYKSKKLIIPVFVFLFFLGTVLECALNLEETGFSPTIRSSYLSDNEDMNNIMNYLDNNDADFYRMEKLNGYRSKDDNAWHGYRGVSYFSSTASGGVTNYVGHLGLEHSTNSYGYNGATVLSSAILSTKYIISNQLLAEDSLMTLKFQSGSHYLYEYNYNLPLGFMVNNTLESEWNNTSVNPFLVQNDFIYRTTGIADVFMPVATGSLSNSAVALYPSENSHLYAYVTSNVKSVNVYVGETSKNYDIHYNYIIDLGVVFPGEDIRIASDDTSNSISLYAYTYDPNKLMDALNILNVSGLTVTDFRDGYVKGNITAEEDGAMYTSIPYDKGWKVYIDGKEGDIICFKDALVMVPLSKGAHTIELKYTPEGLYLGMTITIICVIILFSVYLINRFSLLKKKKKNNKNDLQNNDSTIQEEII